MGCWRRCLLEMSKTLGTVTKEKFHNFVVYCKGIESVPDKTRKELEDMDNLSATMLLTSFREHVSPHIEKIAQQDISVLSWCIPSGVVLNHEQITKICRYLELFDCLARQLPRE